MDSVIEEICRVRQPHDIRLAALRRWQDYLRAEIQPRLDALAILEQNAATNKKPSRQAVANV